MTSENPNPYIFGDPEIDRQRLDAAAKLYSELIRAHAYDYVGNEVKRILDAGCGEGQLGFALQSIYPDSELVGVDRDVRALDKAKASAEAQGLKTTFVQGDIQDQLPGSDYDVILCFTVMQHLPRYPQALELMIAALAPGGHLWILDAGIDCFDYYPNPDFQRTVTIYRQAMQALGNDISAISKLPALMTAHGLLDVHPYAWDIPVGGLTVAGQNMLANILGALYTARKMLHNLTGVDEDEMGKLIEGIADDAVMNPNPGFLRMTNIVASKPKV